MSDLPAHPMSFASGHACQRALQRFGAAPSGSDWADVVVAITDALSGRKADAVLLARQRDGNERWAVRVRGVPMVVVWSPHSERPIITVLDNGRRSAFSR